LKEIRDAIPGRFFVRDTTRGLLYLSRDFLLAAVAWTLALYIDHYFQGADATRLLTPFGAGLARWAAWGV